MTERMPLQPDPDPAHETLVQPEGVNAGSEASMTESSHGSSGGSSTLVEPSSDADDSGTPPHGDPLRPSDGNLPAADDDAPGTLPGAPETTPAAPSQYAAESGQDSGSMA